MLAGAALTVGAIGWTTGSWLQSQAWLQVRRDRLITLGCVSVALGLGVAGAGRAGARASRTGVVAVAWIFAGLGMGLATSSTSLAVMTLSAEAEQGRNASSLNLCDALGAGLFVGVSGTIFAALHPSGNLALTFGAVLLAMAVVACWRCCISLRIGPVKSEFAAH